MSIPKPPFKKMIYILLLVLFPMFVAPVAVSAVQSPTYFANTSGILGKGIDCNNPDNAKSTYCIDNNQNNGIYGNGGAFQNITNIVAFAAGAGAILIIIVGGIRYVTSGGDANKVSSAKSTIVAALIGVAVIALARSLIDYVVGKL